MCKVLEMYIKIAQGESQIEDCSVDEQRVINKVLSSDILNDFFINNADKVETQEELALLLANKLFCCCGVNADCSFG